MRARTFLKPAAPQKRTENAAVKKIVSDLVNEVAWKHEQEQDRIEERRKYFKRLAKVPGYPLMLKDALERISSAALSSSSSTSLPLRRSIYLAKILIRLEIDLGKREDPFLHCDVDTILVPC